MDQAKIRLSPKEMELVTSGDWILTKNQIIEKVKSLLALVMDDQMKQLQLHKSGLAPELIESTPKISKGENYRGLPYLILDYPRVFRKENTCAIRTMFWWGHFISITLHLSGESKSRYETRIISHLPSLSDNDFYISMSKNEWDHHFEGLNYVPVSSITGDIDKKMSELKFIKLARRIPLQQWDEIPGILSRNYALMLELLVD